MAANDVFSDAKDEAFTRYEVELVVRDKLIGGVPKDADTIKKWLESRLDLGERAVIELAEEAAEQMSESGGRPSASELLDAVARKTEGGNGFKIIDGQLVYEGRCMKAALKEASNVAFPGTDWPGKPKTLRKGLMRALAERVFIEQNYIPLGVSSPSGTEQRIKHVMTPQGPRSAINVVDYVEQPKLSFVVAVLDDFLPREAWRRLWQIAEEIGIGADRARSDGKFDLLKWERLPG